jgi:hypothetical protein
MIDERNLRPKIIEVISTGYDSSSQKLILGSLTTLDLNKNNDNLKKYSFIKGKALLGYFSIGGIKVDGVWVTNDKKIILTLGTPLKSSISYKGADMSNYEQNIIFLNPDDLNYDIVLKTLISALGFKNELELCKFILEE